MGILFDMGLFVQVLYVQDSWIVNSLRVDGFGVDPGCIMCEPYPIIKALTDTDLELLLFDFDLQEHLNKFLAQFVIEIKSDDLSYFCYI